MEAVISAIVLTALIAFPAASQNIDYGGEASPIVEDESALNTDVSIDSVKVSEASIERADSLYTVEESHTHRIESLSTPEADLELVIDNSSRIYRLEMPEGTLVQGVDEGLEVSEFEGADRSTVFDKMQELKDRLEDERELVRDEHTPDVGVRVTQSKTADDDQRSVITNYDSETVDFDGWRLSNQNAENYTFDELSVDPGDQVFVYMASEQDLNVSENDEDHYVYDTGVSWNSFGDHAVLENSKGVLIDEDEY